MPLNLENSKLALINLETMEQVAVYPRSKRDGKGEGG